MKTKTRKGVRFRDFLTEELKDEGIRRHYKEAKAASQAADAVVEARRRAGLTQEELARRIGTDQKGIWRLEAGQQNATVETLEKVAQATGSQLSIRIEAAPRTRDSGRLQSVVRDRIDNGVVVRALRKRGRVAGRALKKALKS